MRTRMQERAPRILTSALLLTLLAALLLAGSALAAGHDVRAAAAKPGKPTAKAPKGTITTATPSFTWSKAKGAGKYELRVSQGSRLLLKKTGLKKTSYTAVKALPTNVALTWKVRASNARGAGAWSKSLRFTFVPALTIGDAYQGGIVAYILQPGDLGYGATVQHGLIAAAADQTGGGASDGIQWATVPCLYISVPGTSTAIGTGAANTTAIIAQNGSGSTYAAGLARAYAGGGYSDWYLPSKDELDKLYLNRVAIGGFETATYPWYWSSSQYADVKNGAWGQYFDGGNQDYDGKVNAGRVRAIRAF